MPRRERASIMGEVLDELSRAGGRGGGGDRLTHVAARCNLPYDRFREYVRDLRGRGLLDADDPFRLTAKGRAFLDSYRAWRESLRLFGLEPPDR